MVYSSKHMCFLGASYISSNQVLACLWNLYNFCRIFAKYLRIFALWMSGINVIGECSDNGFPNPNSRSKDVTSTWTFLYPRIYYPGKNLNTNTRFNLIVCLWSSLEKFWFCIVTYVSHSMCSALPNLLFHGLPLLIPFRSKLFIYIFYKVFETTIVSFCCSNVS